MKHNCGVDLFVRARSPGGTIRNMFFEQHVKQTLLNCARAQRHIVEVPGFVGFKSELGLETAFLRFWETSLLSPIGSRKKNWGLSGTPFEAELRCGVCCACQNSRRSHQKLVFLRTVLCYIVARSNTSRHVFLKRHHTSKSQTKLNKSEIKLHRQVVD